MKEILPFLTLLFVMVMAVSRNFRGFKITITQSMLSGALVLLFSGSISPARAFLSVKFDVILFLFGMFIFGEALNMSGLLSLFLERTALRTGSAKLRLLLFITACASLSALFMNDTIAIIGVPAALYIAGRTKINPKILLLSLAFSITIGSVFSPIGNPQNLIIALQSPFPNPFVYFFIRLFIPTALNLAVLFLLILFIFKKELNDAPTEDIKLSEEISDIRLASICKLSIILVVMLIAIKIITVSLFGTDIISLVYIAVIPAAPIIFFSNKRFEILKRIDFSTLLFFISMFIVMQSVFDTSCFTGLSLRFQRYVSSPIFIMSAGIGISQFISNVPFVSLLMPVFRNLMTQQSQYALLAASSTIAGNLMILGAASNVIIIQRAEKSGETISFMEFFRIGLPLTLINAAVYLIFHYISVFIFKN